MGRWMFWPQVVFRAYFSSHKSGGSLLVNNRLILLQGCINLVGYYEAALLIDKTSIVWTRLQMFSFLVMLVLFLVTGLIFFEGMTCLI